MAWPVRKLEKFHRRMKIQLKWLGNFHGPFPLLFPAHPSSRPQILGRIHRGQRRISKESYSDFGLQNTEVLPATQSSSPLPPLLTLFPSSLCGMSRAGPHEPSGSHMFLSATAAGSMARPPRVSLGRPIHLTVLTAPVIAKGVRTLLHRMMATRISITT